MENHLNYLIDLLTREIALHEALKAELDIEAEQDGKLDGATLLRLQQNKNIRVRDIQSLERERIDLVARIAEVWGKLPADLSLKQIIARAPEPESGRLAECHRRLVELVEGIRSAARITSGNAHARLKAIDATLAVIGEAARMHPTYSGEGRLQKKPPTFKETSA